MILIEERNASLDQIDSSQKANLQQPMLSSIALPLRMRDKSFGLSYG
jgi:hypothetical protein